ncbi:zinc transporter foi [Thrips palmi]|uniref:Zinc transporter foi n=1 Tax=Thrips palmi TaxID=161013 RepID=A0A6P8YPN9_THRPL|nr:zinc transporter foi [Thrips palmi]XP_034241908.1 zinc transporter foi [Thrips palmi]XP_034241909.1 zinc transporter foi [Thrips palmi]XP_034241910.1 zinc transporter foi [Thrips palmi]
MKQHLVTVCLVCILCATHAPCSAHQQDVASQSPLNMGSKGTVHVHNDPERRERHHEVDLENQVFIKKMFMKYGDGESLTVTGFGELMKALKLDQLFNKTDDKLKINNSSNNEEASRCVQIENLVGASHGTSNLFNESAIDAVKYAQLCPLLLYKIVEPTNCLLRSEMDPNRTVTWSAHASELPVETVKTVSVWLYATLSIIVISLCGLLGVAVIPVMQKAYYQQLLQFLVALAVGTLCGDALLHLLPHAMSSGAEDSHSHSHSHGHDHDPHSDNMWKGLVASLGVVFFFFTEKCLTLCAEWRKRHQRKSRTAAPRVRVMRDTEDVDNNTVGEKLCKHKYSSYPYCYGDITKEETLADGSLHKNGGPSSLQLNSAQEDLTSTPALTNDRDAGVTSASGGHDLESEIKELRPSDKDYTIIIREHKNHHHGHSHTHGHVHSAPNNLSSVAWMVIMGDGLHNFTDGMAIGAAFAANIAGGFSTAVAVFCHELPHELGDFAVLLKAGMSAKQAVFYNLLSSVLCFFGMCLGIFLGNTETASQWIFAGAAGMFLYIALVDMIPELSTSHTMEGGSVCQCLLQLVGLMTGIGIMLLIANYEHDLKRSFTD